MDPALKARLTERSDAPALRRLAGHLAAIGTTGGWIALGLPFWPLVVFPHGVLIVFLFTLSHECTHRTPFRTGWLNEAAGHAIAPLLALPFLWFRYFHLAHHRHTADPERDPELIGHARPDTFGRWALHLSGWPYWRTNLTVLWRHAANRFSAAYLPAGRHAAMRREARAILALYALAAASLTMSSLAFWLWLLPVLLGQPVLRLFLLAEHGLCPPVADMLANSRTTYTTRLVRLLAWNMPYHTAHHSLPAVPFHKLPALNRALARHLKTTAPGYSAFTAEYLRHLSR